MIPQEYFDRIKNLRNPDEIKLVCEELTAELFNETDKPKTRINKLSAYNALIKTIPNEDLVECENAYIQTRSEGSFWKRHLHFKFTGIADTNFNGKDGINTKTVVLNRLGNKQLLPVTEYLKATCLLLQSNDPHELAVGLIAASGRRPIEILARGSFTLESELPEYLKPGYFVNFRGQAKKRDYEDTERAEYRIGLLVPAVTFLQAFEKFRAMPESVEILEFLKNHEGTPEKVNAMIEDRRGNSLRRVTQRSFKGVSKRSSDLELNPKTLRAMYVALVSERDCPKHINDLLWKAQSLGHFIDSLNANDSGLIALLTTLGYSDFYTDTEVSFTPELTITPLKKAMITTAQTTTQITETTEEKKSRKSVTVSGEAFTKIKELQIEWGLDNQHSVVDKLLKMLDEKSQEITSEKRLKVERDLEKIDTTDLKKLRGEDAVIEKIRRAFEAIATYNDKQPSNDERWYIGNQTMRQVSGCNGLSVSVWIKNYQVSVDDHNTKYGLGQYHNKRHAGKDLVNLITGKIRTSFSC